MSACAVRRRPFSRLARALALGAALVAGGPAGVSAGEEPSPADVSAAIDRGVAWLHGRYQDGGLADERFTDLPELVVLTLAHCGANNSDKTFKAALNQIAEIVPRFTYRASLQAMALSEVNARLYETKLAHCAQWLVDMQLPGGEWGYPGKGEGLGDAVPGVLVEPPPPPPPPPESAAAGKPGAKPGSKPAAKPAERPRYVIQRRQSQTAAGTLKGDFSNTQLAILGLRACREGGIELPKETWTAALGYLRTFQREDGGFGYVVQGEQDGASYASLTCAGACSLAICLAALGSKDPKSDAGVKKALAWMDKRLDVSANVGIDQSSVIGLSPWQYYHLYSLERAGRALNLEKIGRHSWYADGARWLLGAQASDGSWADGEGRGSRPSYLTPADTCFALLFLTRKTRPVTGRCPEVGALPLPAASPAVAGAPLRDVDVVVTHEEVNGRHGTGILVGRLFGGGADVVSVRSRDSHGGEHRLGRLALRLSHPLGPVGVRRRVRAAFLGLRVRRVVCVPFGPADVRTALALREQHGCRLCTYVMDDRNIEHGALSDRLLRALFQASDLRLGISPELCRAYEQKFGLPFALVPPVVDPALVQARATAPPGDALAGGAGGMVGNVWGRAWLRELRRVVREAGARIVWYSNLGNRGMTDAVRDLERDGIELRTGLSESEVVERIRRLAYVVVPSGTGTRDDKHRCVARLSLPSKVPFVLATSGTPLLVLGQPDDAVARFVVGAGVGVQAPYTAEAFRAAVTRLGDPAVQQAYRRRAAALAPAFSAAGVAEWIWRSLEVGHAVDDRWQALAQGPAAAV